MNTTIAEKLNTLPTDSGVYIMLNSDNTIIYIGKAVNLKNRVRQYFRNNIEHDKVRAMVSHIADFRYIITNNEVDALVLEANLIKKHKPLYNILLKDDKDYPFIRINVKEKFPIIEVVRRLKDDGALYFGPYMRGIAVSDIVDIIDSAFLLRKCKGLLKHNERPCLNRDIGRCLAPCVNVDVEENYRLELQRVTEFLKGDDKHVLGVLNEKMESAVEREDFENAIFYRDKIKQLEKIVRKQITALPKEINSDIVACVNDGNNTCVSILCVRHGRMCGGDTFVFEAKLSDEIETLTDFLAQYYMEQTPPSEIIINIESAQDLIKKFFENRNEKVTVTVPQKATRHELLKMCVKNGEEALFKAYVKSMKQNADGRAVEQLSEILGIPYIRRMEAYDISNTGGSNNVSSMVVFTDGKANHAMYRRFKIKTVEGANDFACMAETLTRRLEELRLSRDVSFSEKPDLIVIDGGKGQLGYAYRMLCDSGYDINMVSLAKREEEIFLPNRNEPIVIPHTFPALKLMQRLRDEAHRFAITYHRKLRADAMTRSVLGEIDGLGDRSIEKLYKRFKSLEKIKEASVEELITSGINKRIGEKIYEHFRQDKV